MTARPRRRKRRTLLAVVATVALVALAAVVVTMGAMTLLDSEEGEAVAADEREVIALPETPNALLAVTDDKGRLTSLVVATLDPDGEGGSIVTVPVNADSGAGFEPTATPLEDIFDPADIEPLRVAVEGMLAILIERADVMTSEQLADLVKPLTPLDVQIPEDVVDSDSGGTGIIVSKGDRTLRASAVGDVLASHTRAGKSYKHHDVDVAVWSELAEAAPALPPREDPDVPPESVHDLFEDLWRGEVAVRDLALSVAVVDPTGPKIDSVIVDRRDSLLVFAQVSPSLVSKPNQALSFRVISRFNDEQMEASDGLFESNSEIARRFIGELLFFQGNPMSADTNGAVEGAREVTLVEVVDPRFLDDLAVLGEAAFGEIEIVEAARIIEGVDVVVTLGESYIQRKVDGEVAATEVGDAAAQLAGDADEPGDGLTTDTDESPDDTVDSDE